MEWEGSTYLFYSYILIVRDQKPRMPKEIKKPKKKRARRDPWAKAPPGRLRGTTRVHKLPAPIREECHQRLAARYPLEQVEAWLVRMGYTHVTVPSLRYYRKTYVKPAKIIGGKLLSRWLTDMGFRIDPLLTMQQVLARQLMRLTLALDEEEGAGVVIPQTGEEIERTDMVIGHFYKMLQEIGLMPLPTKHVKTEIAGALDQTVVGAVDVSGEVAFKAGDEEASSTLEEFKEALRRGYHQLAQEREAEGAVEEGELPTEGDEE